MPSRLGHGLYYKKIVVLKKFFVVYSITKTCIIVVGGRGA